MHLTILWSVTKIIKKAGKPWGKFTSFLITVAHTQGKFLNRHLALIQ